MGEVFFTMTIQGLASAQVPHNYPAAWPCAHRGGSLRLEHLRECLLWMASDVMAAGHPGRSKTDRQRWLMQARGYLVGAETWLRPCKEGKSCCPTLNQVQCHGLCMELCD